METAGLNFFIINDNKSLLDNLKKFLRDKFGAGLSIRTFRDNYSALQEMNEFSGIVIFDSEMDAETGGFTKHSIRKINPEIEIIMLSSNQEIGKSIDQYLHRKSLGSLGEKGKPEDKLKATGSRYTLVYFKEYIARRFLLIFLLTFVLMGFGVYYILSIMD